MDITIVNQFVTAYPALSIVLVVVLMLIVAKVANA